MYLMEQKIKILKETVELAFDGFVWIMFVYCFRQCLHVLI